MGDETATAAAPAAAPQRGAARAHIAEVPASALRIGGVVPFSSVDYPDHLAAVVFIQGCPWRCGYCHNPHLQQRSTAPATGAVTTWAALQPWLKRRAGLIDAVVFSGGEPTADPALPAAMAQARALGLKVGLHTAGIYPRRLQQALVHTDWVGLDVKAPLADAELHDRITGVRGSTVPAARALAALLASGVDHECRTTAHPALLDDGALLVLAEDLAAAGVRRWALQVARRSGCATPLPPVPADYPQADTLAVLERSFEKFALRRE